MDWADVLTTDSKFVQSEYTKLGKKFEYIPAPLDSKKFQDIPMVEKKNQIVFVGRDSYEKGIDILRNIEPKLNASVKYCTKNDLLHFSGLKFSKFFKGSIYYKIKKDGGISFKIL